MSNTWGESDFLESTEIYGRETDPNTYHEIKLGDANYANYQHASHVLVYANTTKLALHVYPRIAIIVMQMRFDGYIGFPGGLVDEGENPAEAVNREMEEEIGWETLKHGEVTDKDHLFSHVDEAKKLVLHFYGKQISEEFLNDIEACSIRAKEHGDESLGIILVPLYTMGDGFRGFPAFLKNNFIGNAKKQLLLGLVKLGIMSQSAIDVALKSNPLGC